MFTQYLFEFYISSAATENWGTEIIEMISNVEIYETNHSRSQTEERSLTVHRSQLCLLQGCLRNNDLTLILKKTTRWERRASLTFTESLSSTCQLSKRQNRIWNKVNEETWNDPCGFVVRAKTCTSRFTASNISSCNMWESPSSGGQVQWSCVFHSSCVRAADRIQTQTKAG